jgi:23S rRNA (cytosine1962-C5)-methyltransferase
LTRKPRKGGTGIGKMAVCVLKKGAELPLKGGYPWVYAWDLKEESGEAGEVVDLLDHRLGFIARGHYSPHSSIRVRILTWRREVINEAFFEKRLKRAFSLRENLLRFTGGLRLVNSEGDLLPGLVVDKYEGVLVLQVHTPGMEHSKELLLSLLEKIFNPQGILEKSDPFVRQKEGLPPFQGVLRGEVPEMVEIREGELRFKVALFEGQKTGFYLDQRDHRQLVLRISRDKKVLDCFCYSGGFGIAALKGGAPFVKAVDTSERALLLAQENCLLNGLPRDKFHTLKADVFEFLRMENEKYDLIILDPPPFARSREEVPNALRGYEELNFLALKRLSKGGILFSFCCTQRVSRKDFFQCILKAAKRAGRLLQLLYEGKAPMDHPVLINHPEGHYLKGFLLRVLN